MRHTKGKWLLENSGLTMFKYSIETDDNSTEIARVGTKPDAILISKAPEMYESLRELYEESVITSGLNVARIVTTPDMIIKLESLLKEIES